MVLVKSLGVFISTDLLTDSLVSRPRFPGAGSISFEFNSLLLHLVPLRVKKQPLIVLNVLTRTVLVVATVLSVIVSNRAGRSPL